MKNDTQNSENNFYATVHEIQIKCSRGDAKIWHITKMERNNDYNNSRCGERGRKMAAATRV